MIFRGGRGSDEDETFFYKYVMLPQGSGSSPKQLDLPMQPSFVGSTG